MSGQYRPFQQTQPPPGFGAPGVQPRVKPPAAINPFLPLQLQFQAADPRSYGRPTQGQFQPKPQEIAGANGMEMAEQISHHQGFNARPQPPSLFHPQHPRQHSIYYPPAMPPPPPDFNITPTTPGFLPPNPHHFSRPPQHWQGPGYVHTIPPNYPPPPFHNFQSQPETFAGVQVFGDRGYGPPEAAGGLGASKSLDPFVEDWLKIVGAARKQRCPERSSFKIPEARALLCSAVELLSRLRHCHQRLASLSSKEDGSVWRSIMQQVTKHKEELEAVRGRLESGDSMEHLVRKVNCHRAKRDRLRRVFNERACVASAKKNRIEAATSSWLEERREKELKEKTEKSVQDAASGLLGEVKRKQSEVQLYLKLANTLKDLRDSRREANRKKGDAPPIEADERFTSGHTSLLQLLTNQARVYEGEEHALRVLMEEEVAEKMATSVATGSKATTDAGPVGVPEGESRSSLISSDPLAPFRDYYLQAEQGGEPLLAIRTEWDRYLSPEGMAIPPGPVVATPPSSSLWAWCCTDSTEQS